VVVIADLLSIVKSVWSSWRPGGRRDPFARRVMLMSSSSCP